MLRCNLRQLAPRGILLRLRQRRPGALGARVRDGNRAHKRPRIRMRGALEDLPRRADLHQTPPVHHAHPVAQKLDCTTPIAPVAATKLKAVPLPQRLYYDQTVFRSGQEHKGGSSEIAQCGVELIGVHNVREAFDACVQ